MAEQDKPSVPADVREFFFVVRIPAGKLSAVKFHLPGAEAAVVDACAQASAELAHYIVGRAKVYGKDIPAETVTPAAA
jgi:hypothetical protein